MSETGKRYQCKSCPKGFNVYSSLWSHQKREHKGHKYICPDCSAQFKYTYQLLSHRVHKCTNKPKSKPTVPIVQQSPYDIPRGTSSLSYNPWL